MYHLRRRNIEISEKTKHSRSPNYILTSLSKLLLSIKPFTNISHKNCLFLDSYSTDCLDISITIRSIIGRAGASPPSRTNRMIFLYIYIYIYSYIRSTVRRALNLLRASFSPIFRGCCRHQTWVYGYVQRALGTARVWSGAVQRTACLRQGQKLFTAIILGVH